MYKLYINKQLKKNIYKQTVIVTKLQPKKLNIYIHPLKTPFKKNDLNISLRHYVRIRKNLVNNYYIKINKTRFKSFLKMNNFIMNERTCMHFNFLDLFLK